MSLWSDIGQFITALARSAFTTAVEVIAETFSDNARQRRRVAFSIALIALSAKMAKADGLVSDSEVEAFKQIFEIPNHELDNVAKLYNLAKGDIAGYDSYARQVKRLFPKEDGRDKEILRDVVDALFHIAKSDGVIHQDELKFLEDVSDIFGFAELDFERLRVRHVDGGTSDPYTILGAEPTWSYSQLKRQYRKRVSESHPDRLIARGVPPEFVAIANDRLAAINEAWQKIEMYHSVDPNRMIE